MAKKFALRSLMAIAIVVVLVMAYPMRSGKSLQDATADEVAQQVPYALDILAARYPFKVGLLRSALNNDGVVDRVAQNFVRDTMKQQDMSLLDCYLMYYYVAFDKDEVRKSMADRMEKELGLA